MRQSKIKIKQHCCTYDFQFFRSFSIIIFFINLVNGNISFYKDETDSEINEKRYNNEDITRNSIIFDLTNKISEMPHLVNRHRVRRNNDLRLISSSAEVTGSSFPWKKRYYVTRWHRRRFVPSRDDGSLLTAVDQQSHDDCVE
uniref:Uncharacterized protein n=1 Tax=Meloidogyne hapla TaxID=6305 RepID=A0A1I8BQS2_MELHA